MKTTSCYDYALKYIYRYPKTKKELKIQLLQKGYGDEESDDAITALEMKGLVSDRKFAESYIYSEVTKKGKPLIRIISKLYQKGIDKHIIDDIVAEQEGDIQEGIEQKISKEIKQYKQKGVEGFDIIQKLMRKGYKLDDIKKVINDRNNT